MSKPAHEYYSDYCEMNRVMMNCSSGLENWMLGQMYDVIFDMTQAYINQIEKLEYKIMELEKELVFKDVK